MLSPEARLVFRTASSACEPSEIAAIARAVTDWPRAFAIAEREVATSVVWRELRLAEAVLPEEAADAFGRAALVRDLAVQRLAQRAQRTSQLLAERGIPFLLLKGAALGALYDPTFRSRPMNDLDIPLQVSAAVAAPPTRSHRRATVDLDRIIANATDRPKR